MRHKIVMLSDRSNLKLNLYRRLLKMDNVFRGFLERSATVELKEQRQTQYQPLS